MVEQAVILAGGLGTRLAPFTDTAPKCMYPFDEHPFIDYLIRQIRNWGIRDVLLLLGYMPDKIIDYLGDGSQYNMYIEYDISPVEYETGMRLKQAVNKIQNNFLLMYCDNYCPVDFIQLCNDFRQHGAMIELSAYENMDGYTKSNLRLTKDGKVEVYDKKRVISDLAGVDIGYAIINKQVLEMLPDENCNFEAKIYPKLLAEGTLYATVTKHRYYSVGSWQRIKLTQDFFEGKPAVFLDRDGTINEKPPQACYVEKPEQFIWLNGAKEAIKMLNENGYRVILITNQPGIARGRLTRGELYNIHDKMEKELEAFGGHLDAIYFCPHNWDEGCECRKPKPGMFFQAQKDFSLDLTRCIMIGDDERDIEAGNRAGCYSIQVTEERRLIDIVKELVVRSSVM